MADPSDDPDSRGRLLAPQAPSRGRDLAPPAPRSAASTLAPLPPEGHPWYEKVGHGFMAGYLKLQELAGRAETAYSNAATGALQKILPRSMGDSLGASVGTFAPHPDSAEDTAQSAFPITKEEQGSPLVTAGQVAGGLAQLPALGPAGPAGAAATFGAESAMDGYDAAKARGMSEKDAWKAAMQHGAITTATGLVLPGIATRINAGTGGALEKLARMGGAFVGTGLVDQTLHNWVHQHTDEPELKLLTGLSGRAATDAAVGLFMTALFPGHRMDGETIRSTGGSVLPEVRMAGEEPPEMLKPDVTLGFDVKAAMDRESAKDVGSAMEAGRQRALSGEGPTPDQAQFEAEARAKYPELTSREAMIKYSAEEPPPDTGGKYEETPEEAAQREAVGSKGIPGTASYQPAVHPAQGLIDEMGAVTSRMNELDARAKDLRQRGRTAASLPLDQERLVLLRRQGELAQQIQAKVAGVQPEAEVPAEKPHPIDERLKNDHYHQRLKFMAAEAGWDQEGGQKIVRGEEYSQNAEDKGRTSWIPKAEWWPDRPTVDPTGEEQMSEVDVKNLVAKVTSEKPGNLGARQKTMLNWMLDQIEQELPPHEDWQEPIAQSIADDYKAAGVAPEQAEAEGEAHAQRLAEGMNGKDPGPPNPPDDSAEAPEPSDPNWRSILENYIGDRNEGSVSAWRLRNLRRLQAMEALGLSKADYLKEQSKPRGQRAWELADEAMSLRTNLLGRVDEQYGKWGDELTDAHKAALQRAGNLNPQQLALADKIKTANWRWSNLLKDEGVISNVIENYNKLIWKGTEPSEAAGRTQKFSTFTTGALPRSYESILEGFSKGNELKVKGLIDQEFWNRQVTSHVLADRRLIDTSVKAGAMSFTAKPGWKLLNYPQFKAWDTAHAVRIKIPETPLELREQFSELFKEPIPLDEIVKVYGRAREGRDGQILGRDMLIKSDGNTITLLRKMPLYAPAEFATKLNNFTGASALSDVWAIKKWEAVQNFVRSSLFAVPVRHMANVTANFMLGTPADRPVDVNPVAAYKNGSEMIEHYGPLVQRAVRSGMLGLAPSGEIQRMLNAEHTRLGKLIDRTPYLSPAKNFVQNELGDLRDFTFDRYMPAVQAHLMTLEHGRLVGTGADDASALRAASRLANNVVGVKNPDAISNPTLYQLRSLFFLAPQWEGAAWRRVGDAYGAGAVAEAHRAMWTRAITRFAAAHVAFNFAMAYLQDNEHPVEQWEKNMEFQYGKGYRKLFGMDVSPALAQAGRNNPTRLYLSLTGNMLEPVGSALIASGAMANAEGKRGPVAAAADLLDSKEGVLPRLAKGMLTGTDWRGAPYTSVAEMTRTDDKGTYKGSKYGQYYAGMPKGGKLGGELSSFRSGEKAGGGLDASQIPSWAIDSSRDALPIPLQAMVDGIFGQMDGWEAWMRALSLPITSAHESKPRKK